MADALDPNAGAKIPLAGEPVNAATVSLPPANPYAANASSAADSNAPTTSTSSSIELEATQRANDMIHNNVLNDYIDATYNISLAMVDNQGAIDLQKTTRDTGTQSSTISEDRYVVFASTADVKTGNSDQNQYDGNYYNIQSLHFTSFVGHLPQNPIVAVTWDGKMRIFEPYGFQFREDINAMAEQLKYPETVSTVNYVYRMEIWFSGWDPITGKWVKNISLKNPQPGNPAKEQSSIVYYLVITTVEAKVTPSGTFYDLSFQTISHFATRAENIVLHKDTIGKGGISIDKTAEPTFQSFLQQLSSKLTAQIFNDTNGKHKINFQFVGLKALMDSKFAENVKIDFTTGVSFDGGAGSYATSAANMDMFTLIHSVMANLDLVRQVLLQEKDINFIEPTVTWNIRTNILEATKPDNEMNSFTDYTFQYVFEPVLSYRTRMTEIWQRNTTIEPANQRARAQKMLDFGMLHRWYDYYFTSGNSEIIDFQFKFKNFYYQQIPYPGSENSLPGVGFNGPNDAVPSNVDKAAASSQGTDVRGIVDPNLAFTAGRTGAGLNVDEMFKVQAPQQSSDHKATAANIHQHRYRGATQFIAGDTSAVAKTNKALAARDDYARWDMISANMTVRFDPQWLLNPYMAGGDSTATVPLSETADTNGGQIFVYAHMDRVVYINAYAPNQAALMNPDSNVPNVKRTPILAGLYQVLTVINEFDGGKFIQKLDMFKYPHLNYFDANAGSSGGDIQGGGTTNAPPGGSGSLPPSQSNGQNGGTSGAADPHAATKLAG